MKTKRKLMLGVASLGILVILAGVTLGITLAALTGTVNSGFTITYSAKNVNAMILGQYIITPMYGFNVDEITEVLVGPDEIIPNSLSGIIFDKNSTSDKNFESVSLEIPAPVLGFNNSVVFVYTIANFDESDLSLKLWVDGEIDDNIEISYLNTAGIRAKIAALEERDDIQEKLNILYENNIIPIRTIRQIELLLADHNPAHLEPSFLDQVKQDKELTEIVTDLATEYNSLFTSLNTFPINATIPPSGYTWEDDLMTAISGDFKATTVYIKVALKDPTVSVKNFSASFKADLAPAV